MNVTQNESVMPFKHGIGLRSEIYGRDAACRYKAFTAFTPTLGLNMNTDKTLP